MSLVRGVTAQDIWDFLIPLSDLDMSFGKLARYHGLLSDHFEALTIPDLPNDYTLTVVGGGTGTLFLDDEPSAIRLATGAVMGDSSALQTDQLISLLALGRQTLIYETRLKINSEANIYLLFGLINTTTNLDYVSILLDTAAGAPQNAGAIQSVRNGGVAMTGLNLTGLLDMTLYHTYRIEFTPGTRIDVFVDDVLFGSEIVAANVPDDQSFILQYTVIARAAANIELDSDYYRVWSQ